MTVENLFELFMSRKITVLILLLLFNIIAFFAYDWMAMNHEIRVKIQYPISEKGEEIVNHTYFFNKYNTSSIRGDVLSGVDKTNYKLSTDNKYLGVSLICEIKENCMTAAKLLIEALNEEAAYVRSNKIYEMELLARKQAINNLDKKRKSFVNKRDRYVNKMESYANKRDVLISTAEEYFQISEENINKANNPDNLNTILLLEGINNARRDASSELADVSVDLADVSVDLANTSIQLTAIENEISREKLGLRSYSELNKPKHFFIWVVEPNLGDIGRVVSFSLWLTLSFLMSIALYFIAAVLINTKQT